MKVTMGIIVSEARGKVSGNVFSKNKGGAIVRNRVTPINRRSTSQQNQRQQLAALAASWRGLTDAQRAGWNAASPNFPQSDNLGQTIFLSGEQLYIRCNLNLLLIGESQIVDAPTPTSFDVLAFTSLSPDASAGTIGLAFSPTVPAGFAMVVRATAPYSAGKSFVPQSAFRFIDAIAAAQTSPQAIGPAYVAVHGAITGATGQKIAVEMFLVEITSGLAGIPVRGVGVVVA